MLKLRDQLPVLILANNKLSHIRTKYEQEPQQHGLAVSIGDHLKLPGLGAAVRAAVIAKSFLWKFANNFNVCNDKKAGKYFEYLSWLLPFRFC